MRFLTFQKCIPISNGIPAITEEKTPRSAFSCFSTNGKFAYLLTFKKIRLKKQCIAMLNFFLFFLSLYDVVSRVN